MSVQRSRVIRTRAISVLVQDTCTGLYRTGHLHRSVQDRLTSQVSIGEVTFTGLYRTGYFHRSVQDRLPSQAYTSVHIQKDRLSEQFCKGQVSFTGLYRTVYRHRFVKDRLPSQVFIGQVPEQSVHIGQVTCTGLYPPYSRLGQSVHDFILPRSQNFERTNFSFHGISYF